MALEFGGMNMRKFCGFFGLGFAAFLLFVFRVEAVNVFDTSQYGEGPFGGMLKLAEQDSDDEGTLPDVGGIEVSDEMVDGQIWAENFGWIDMQSDIFFNPYDRVRVQVVREDLGEGEVTIGRLFGTAVTQENEHGFVWFGPWDTDGDLGVDTDTGVYIDRDGYFQGTAWSEQYGVFSFGDYMLLNSVSNEFTDNVSNKDTYWARTSWVPNFAPTVADGVVLGEEDVSFVFGAADFSGKFSDVEGDSLAVIKIVSLPVKGVLELSGEGVGVGDEIVVGDIGNLVFVPDDDWYGETVFQWKGSDGFVFSQNAATFRLNILAVNDVPGFTSLVGQVAGFGEVYELDLNVLGEPSDLENDGLSWGVKITDVAVGDVAVGEETAFSGEVRETGVGSGVFLFDPGVAGFDGKIAFTVTLTDDGEPAGEVEQVGVVLDWVDNSAPVILGGLGVDYSVAEGSALVLNLSDGDKFDAEDSDANLVWSILGFEDGGYVVDVGDINQITFTPDDVNFAGTEEVTLVLKDSVGAVDMKSLNLTWTGVNDAPVANAVSWSVEEGGETVIKLDGADVDDGDVLTYSIDVEPGNGALSLPAASGGVVYDNTILGVTSDSFTYRVTDGLEEFDTAVVTISIAGVNDAPVSGDGVLAVFEGQVGVVGGLSSLVDDPEDDVLTYSIVKSPEHGTVVIDDVNTGTYTYSHNGDEGVSDSFTFWANDGSLDSDISTVDIAVDPVNDAPTFTDLPAMSSPTGEVLVLDLNELAAPVDAEGDGLVWSYTLDDGDKDGDEITWAGSGGSDSIDENGVLTFTPAGGFGGQIEISVTVTDDGSPVQSDVQVGIVLTWLNNINPVISGLPLIVSYTAVEDVVMQTLPFTGFDADGDDLTWSVVGFDFGEVEVVNNGSFRFIPDLNFVGSDDVTLMLKDDRGGFSTAILTLDWDPLNDSPDASGGSFRLDEGGTYNGVLEAEDVEDDSLTYVLVEDGEHGAVTITDANTGAFSYVHDGGESTGDRFTFNVFDGTSYSDVAVVSVVVNPVNDPPVAEDTAIILDEGAVEFGALLSSDVDGGVIEYVIDALPANGSVRILNTESGSFVYEHDGSDTLSDSFTFKVGDGNRVSDAVGTVLVRVLPKNNLPVAGDSDFGVLEGGVLSDNLIASDFEGDVLNYVVVSTPEYGDLTLENAETGLFVYRHRGGEEGSDGFTFKVSDGDG